MKDSLNNTNIMAIKNKSATQKFVKFALALSLMPSSVDSLNQQSPEFEETEHFNSINIETSLNSIHSDDYKLLDVMDSSEQSIFNNDNYYEEEKYITDHNNNVSDFNEVKRVLKNKRLKTNNCSYGKFKKPIIDNENIDNFLAVNSSSIDPNNEYNIHDSRAIDNESVLFKQGFLNNPEIEEPHESSAINSLYHTLSNDLSDEKLWNFESSNYDDQLNICSITNTISDDSWLTETKNDTLNLDECFSCDTRKDSPWFASEEMNGTYPSSIDDDTLSVITEIPTFIDVYQHSSNSDSLNEEFDNELSPFTMNGSSLNEYDIINMNFTEFQEMCKKLSGDDQRKVKELRRRGKNKMAARSCRRRKMDSLDILHDEVRQLEIKHDQLSKIASSLETDIDSLRAKISEYKHFSNTPAYSSILMAN